jgi:outer membrane usher protein FimD/PapC
MMGQRVKQLANKPYQAGNHVVSFEAGNLASGMYLYQLWVNGKWVGTHTMTLIK